MEFAALIPQQRTLQNVGNRNRCAEFISSGVVSRRTLLAEVTVHWNLPVLMGCLDYDRHTGATAMQEETIGQAWSLQLCATGSLIMKACPYKGLLGHQNCVEWIVQSTAQRDECVRS